MNTMKQIATIFTFRFFDFEKNEVRIGGIETYTLDLSFLFMKMGFETTVVVLSDDCSSPKECNYKGINVKEIVKERSYNNSFQKIYSAQSGQGIYVIMTDDMNVNSLGKPNVITIQHGIWWDNPSWSYSKKFRNKWVYPLMKLFTSYNHIKIFKGTSNLVCVDYNYYNWIRTLHDIPDNMHIAVIPNYSSSKISQDEFDSKLSMVKDLRKSKIVFARRFTRYRGAQLFANVTRKLIAKYPELEITFAGDGDMKQQLENDFKDFDNVCITQYKAEESITFHKKFDIAVVPTIYSEGTSLSLCEAMSAGCMPVATHVGGLTNLIIDSYNGRLCYPDENGVYNAIVELIDSSLDNYKEILRNAYNSACTSFSRDKWEERWQQYIEAIIAK